MSPTSPFWVANNGTGTATLYAGDVNGSPFTRNPWWSRFLKGPPRARCSIHSRPTSSCKAEGRVPGRCFSLPLRSGSSADGIPVCRPPDRPQAQVGGSNDAVYTGLAIGSVGAAHYLYAADFEHGKIDVYDTAFHVVTLAGTFSDPNIPTATLRSTFRVWAASCMSPMRSRATRNPTRKRIAGQDSLTCSIRAATCCSG